LCGFCCISATKEPVQPHNFVSGLHSLFKKLFALASQTFVSTRYATSAYATAPIFHLIWQDTLKAATNNKGCNK